MPLCGLCVTHCDQLWVCAMPAPTPRPWAACEPPAPTSPSPGAPIGTQIPFGKGTAMGPGRFGVGMNQMGRAWACNGGLASTAEHKTPQPFPEPAQRTANGPPNQEHSWHGVRITLQSCFHSPIGRRNKTTPGLTDPRETPPAPRTDGAAPAPDGNPCPPHSPQCQQPTLTPSSLP